MRSADNLARKLNDAFDESLHNDFARAVLEGLTKPAKSLPCRFFYDARGSALFEEITRLPEYYQTRAEAEILGAHARDIVGRRGDATVLVEFGSGSSLKTEALLDEAGAISSYVAIDVSATALAEAKSRLQLRYPSLDIITMVADFAGDVRLPTDLSSERKIGFFPGSTIGNLCPRDAQHLLRNFAAVLGSGARLIVGVDLKKDVRALVAAYNDAAGVTAAFNLNLLARINRELGAQFDESTFEHQAIYNPRDGRIEMRLVSTCDQAVEVSGSRIPFRAGESIHTENSYKYTVDEFRALAETSGWLAARVWTDAAMNFSVHELTRPAL